MTNLPVLGITLEHHGVLGLADIAVVVLLDLLGALLGLDSVILGEGALVAGTAGVCQEVRADRLDCALRRALGGELANRLEVFFGSPALREGRKRNSNKSSSHFAPRCEGVWYSGGDVFRWRGNWIL